MTADGLYTVSELNDAVKNLIEPNLQNIQVKGEVTNLRLQSSGHTYFSLKDNHAQVSAVLFRRQGLELKTQIRAGDQVVVTGSVSLYQPRGTYQIVVLSLKNIGVGDLLLQFHALKEKFKNAGWFSSDHKVPIPKHPKSIGVVTSRSGSVIRDIIHVLKRRCYKFHLILYPAKVQGVGAADEISAAIEFFNTHELVDLIIVGRGGGSVEDLWQFNEESVVKAIFTSTIPIISAVGHETDVTLADYAADVRAPTPSAAAEIATQEYATNIKFLRQSEIRVINAVKQKVAGLRVLLNTVKRHRIIATPALMLFDKHQRLDDRADHLTKTMGSSATVRRESIRHLKKELGLNKFIQDIAVYKSQIVFLCRECKSFSQKYLHDKKVEISQLTRRLNSLNPQSVLNRGYCKPYLKNNSGGTVSISDVNRGDMLGLCFKDGDLEVSVEKVKLRGVINGTKR